MGKDKFEVVLAGLTSIQYAFNEREAIILAQAEAIKDARSYEVVSIVRIR